MRNRLIAPLAACCFLVTTVSAADTDEHERFFEAKIRPVLVEHCHECHSASSKDPGGGLLLDTREGIRQGGETGHAVVPGELNDSLILSAMRHESLEMPPDEKLPKLSLIHISEPTRLGMLSRMPSSA